MANRYSRIRGWGAGWFQRERLRQGDGGRERADTLGALGSPSGELGEPLAFGFEEFVDHLSAVFDANDGAGEFV